MTSPDIAIVGAVALDEIHSQSGEIHEELGGSALFAALAASILARSAPISVIGDDFDPALLDPFAERGIILDAINAVPGPNFRWGCRYSDDGDFRETLFTRGGVYDSHPIDVPSPITDAKYLVLTSGNPDQNRRVQSQIHAPELVALDTIEREVAERTQEFRDQIRSCDLVSINEQEAALLIDWPGDHLDPRMGPAAWSEIHALGASVFVLKQASQGAEVFETSRHTKISAVPGIHPTDPTGAGDTFLGAMISAMAHGRDLVNAAVWGCAVASFVIEAYGFAGLFRATLESVQARANLITTQSDP